MSEVSEEHDDDATTPPLNKQRAPGTSLVAADQIAAEYWPADLAASRRAGALRQRMPTRGGGSAGKRRTPTFARVELRSGIVQEMWCMSVIMAELRL